MENSSFRQFFKEGGSQKPAEDSAEARKAKAEDAQRKKAKAKASQERRMAILKKREEQLAEASKYKDRAAERRKELDRAIKAGEAAPEAIDEAGMGADAFIQQSQEEKEAALPTGLTYAQADGREDLERQQHRVSIAQSKYLGGDIEHTHLVKGLDFALLQKNRAQLSAEEREKEAAERERAEKAERRGGAPAAQGSSAARRGGKKIGDGVGSSLEKPAESEMARVTRGRVGVGVRVRVRVGVGSWRAG
jgi:IK cytokine